MPVILSLDTSSTACSVALHVDGRLLAFSDIHKEHSHGARLALLIQQVLENAGVTFQQLSGIGLSSGPGSYTGLRIGASTAKGLCYALNLPLVAIDSLTVMAHRVVKEKRDEMFYCPMLDARRMEVYCAVYNSSLTVLESIQAKVIDENSFAELLGKGKTLFFGNGAGKCREVIRHPNAIFLEDINPSAIEVGELAVEKFKLGKVEDLVHFEPLYLKEFLIKKSSKLDSLLNK
jgi:tRNA threonylcarbamoyladenosine biosynthesis protein TsaB